MSKADSQKRCIVTAENLAAGWRKYTSIFGKPPHGTVEQMLALLELSKPKKVVKRV